MAIAYAYNEYMPYAPEIPFQSLDPINPYGPSNSGQKQPYFFKVIFSIFWPTYRVIQVKVDETKQLFQIENMDRFLINFDYCKGGEVYMVP